MVLLFLYVLYKYFTNIRYVKLRNKFWLHSLLLLLTVHLSAYLIVVE